MAAKKSNVRMKRPTVIKECPRHGMTEHVFLGDNKWKCKECIHDNIRDIRHRYKLRLVEYKGGKCEICGYDKCVDALEFHHLNPNEKDFSLTCGDTRSFEKLKSESDKCILVCANCHREIHAEERNRQRKEKEEREIENEAIYFSKVHDETNKRRQSQKMIARKLRLDDILERISQKTPKKQIAQDFGVSLKALRNFLNKNGIHYDESINKNKTSQIKVGDFIEEFKKHRCFTKIAKHYGVSDNSIRKWCIKNGMPWRKSEMIDFIKNQDKKE